MTIIPPLSEDFSGDALPGATGQLAQQKAKWMRELERAQRESNYHPQSHDRDNGNTTMADDTPAHRVPRGATPATGESEAFNTDRPLPTPPRFPAASTSSVAVGNLPDSQDGAAAMFMPVAMGPLLPVSISSAANQTAPLASLAMGASSISAQRTWEKQRSHLEEKDGEIRMWLRDARLSDTQGLELAMALRKRFAEVGLKLAHFTLNGHSIAQQTP